MRLRLAVFLLSMIHLCARADSFRLTFNGSGESGSVLLTATATGTTDEFRISAASGMIDQQTLSLLSPNVYPPSGPNNNLLFYPASASQASFDKNGVSFLLANGMDYRAQYGSPLADLTGAGFGSIETEANTGPVGTGTPRQVQFCSKSASRVVALRPSRNLTRN